MERCHGFLLLVNTRPELSGPGLQGRCGFQKRECGNHVLSSLPPASDSNSCFANSGEASDSAFAFPLRLSSMGFSPLLLSGICGCVCCGCGCWPSTLMFLPFLVFAGLSFPFHCHVFSFLFFTALVCERLSRDPFTLCLSLFAERCKSHESANTSSIATWTHPIIGSQKSLSLQSVRFALHADGIHTWQLRLLCGQVGQTHASNLDIYIDNENDNDDDEIDNDNDDDEKKIDMGDIDDDNNNDPEKRRKPEKMRIPKNPFQFSLCECFLPDQSMLLLPSEDLHAPLPSYLGKPQGCHQTTHLHHLLFYTAVEIFSFPRLAESSFKISCLHTQNFMCFAQCVHEYARSCPL